MAGSNSGFRRRTSGFDQWVVLRTKVVIKVVMHITVKVARMLATTQLRLMDTETTEKFMILIDELLMMEACLTMAAIKAHLGIIELRKCEVGITLASISIQ